MCDRCEIARTRLGKGIDFWSGSEQTASNIRRQIKHYEQRGCGSDIIKERVEELRLIYVEKRLEES